MKHVLKRTDWL